MRIRGGRARGRCRGRAGRVAIGVLAWLCAPALAGAQSGGASAPAPLGGVEVSVGGAWASGQLIGSSTAALTSNATPRGGRVTLFDARTELASALFVETAVAVRIARALAIEGRFGFARPRVRTAVTGDTEAAPSVTFTGERLGQYVAEGSLVLHLTGMRFRGGRAGPYLRGGAGVLRELHEPKILAENGMLYHLGGGLGYLLAHWPDRVLRGLVVRAEARAYVRTGAFALDDDRRVFGTGGGALVLLF